MNDTNDHELNEEADHPVEARTLEQRRADLEAEVARRKARREARGETETTERVEVAPVAFSVAEVMPEMIASMARCRASWAAFCATVRPKFEALPAGSACLQHPAVMREKLFEETCQQTRLHGVFTAAWAPCPECRAEESRGRARTFWSRRGVPARVVDATLGNFVADTEARVLARGQVQEWVRRRGVFLLLVGTPGTGKGHLAVGCLKAQGNGVFITHADMLSDLRASYTLHTTKEVLAAWQQCELLVLDEFGLSAGGNDEEPMLYQVLAKRYEERRPTIITSNVNLAELRTAIGLRLLDRISEDCTTVTCQWGSWRRRGRGEEGRMKAEG